MTSVSIRQVVKKSVEAADVRPRVADQRSPGEPDEASPHTFRHSIAFRMIRR